MIETKGSSCCSTASVIDKLGKLLCIRPPAFDDLSLKKQAEVERSIEAELMTSRRFFSADRRKVRDTQYMNALKL